MFAAKTEQGDKNALGSTITDLTVLSSFIQGLQGFYEGTENTGSSGALRDQHGVITGYTHKNERVFNEKQNNRIGNISNEDAANVLEAFNKGLLFEKVPNLELKQNRFESNKEVIEKYHEMIFLMKNLHKKMPQDSYSFEAFRGAILHTRKKGNNKISKGFILD